MIITKNEFGKIVFKEIGDKYLFSDNYIGEPLDVGFIEGEGEFLLTYRCCRFEPIMEYSQSSGRRELCGSELVRGPETTCSVELNGQASVNYNILHRLLHNGAYAWVSLEKIK